MFATDRRCLLKWGGAVALGVLGATLTVGGLIHGATTPIRDSLPEQAFEQQTDSSSAPVNVLQNERQRPERLGNNTLTYLVMLGLLTFSIKMLLVRQRQAEARLAMERKRLADSIARIREGFVLLDEQDRLLVCNQRCREPYPSAADLMKPGAWFSDPVHCLDDDGTAGIGADPTNQHESCAHRATLQTRRAAKMPELRIDLNVTQTLVYGHQARVSAGHGCRSRPRGT